MSTGAGDSRYGPTVLLVQCRLPPYPPGLNPRTHKPQRLRRGAGTPLISRERIVMAWPTAGFRPAPPRADRSALLGRHNG
jgi:hypothetical protein